MAIVAVLALPLTASAAKVSLTDGVEVYGGDLSTWLIGDDLIAECISPGSPIGFAVDEGTYWYNGVTRFDDALDGAHFIYVNESIFNDDDNEGEIKGRSVTAGPQPLKGVRVKVTHTALSKEAVVRTLVRFTNDADTDKTRQVAFQGNSGGDGDEKTVDSPSNNQTVLETVDTWVAYSPEPSQPTDPTKVTALFGPGQVRESTANVVAYPGDAIGTQDCLWVDYSIKIPANSTRYMLFFTRLVPTAESGASAGGDYTSEKGFLFEGMSDKVRGQTLNWKI
jgi:hypothetical protein